MLPIHVTSNRKFRRFDYRLRELSSKQQHNDFDDDNVERNTMPMKTKDCTEHKDEHEHGHYRLFTLKLVDVAPVPAYAAKSVGQVKRLDEQVAKQFMEFEFVASVGCTIVPGKTIPCYAVLNTVFIPCSYCVHGPLPFICSGEGRTYGYVAALVDSPASQDDQITFEPPLDSPVTWRVAGEPGMLPADRDACDQFYTVTRVLSWRIPPTGRNKRTKRTDESADKAPAAIVPTQPEPRTGTV